MAEEEVQPRDAKIVKTILQSMGVEHYEPRVVHQFLDFSYRYVLEVLEDANVYAEHAGKPALDMGDVRLAIQSKVNVSFSQPPPREKLMELAKVRNSVPLPRSVGSSTLALPPEADSLIAPNYQLAVPPRPILDRSEIQQEQGSKNGSDERDGDGPVSQPTQLQRTDQDRKVSFAISTKRLKSG